MRMALALVVLLLAGCVSTPPAPLASSSTAPASPPHTVVTVTFKIVDPDGNPMPGAELYAVPKAEVSADPLKLPVPHAADQRGETKLAFPAATDIVVQAFGPSRGWTREGMRVSVGEEITADREVPIMDRTVALTLYRSEQAIALRGTWADARASVGPDGSIVPAALAIPVPLDPRYAERLSGVDVKLSWNNTATVYGDLFTGITYSDAQTPGDDHLQAPGPSNSAETASASLNPVAGATLSVNAFTARAIVGQLDLTWTGTMHFGGFYPEELPAPACLAASDCGLPLLPP